MKFLDLAAINAPYQEEIEAALLRVARSDRHILGPEVERFEREWAAYCGTKYCVGVGNALEGLQLILMACGIGKGDEVIVPSNTYIATWLSVTHAGAAVVPVEPDMSFNIDPAKIAAALTKRTKAIIAVHLYGRPANMTAIDEIAQRHGLWLFEDAAQAHGAVHAGRKAGNLSDAASFSFYPTKNLGAIGDAGAVTTNSKAIAERIRALRNYGGEGHPVTGINSRLDEIQAAVLTAKLPHLDEMNAKRRARAESIRGLAGAVTLPEAVEGHVWHQFVVRTGEREKVRANLAQRGIETMIHYPVPPHLEAYADQFHPGQFPIAELFAREVLSLPIA